MKIENVKPQMVKGLALFWEKFKPFVFCMVTVVVFGQIFGNENTFIGISLAMALLTYKYVDIGISPKSASLCLFCLFLLIGFASWANQLGIWISIPINFLTVYILMMCTTMALTQKPYIPPVLCFIFVQGNQVTGSTSIKRMIAFLFTATLIAVFYYVFQHKNPQKRTLKDIAHEAARFSTRTQFALRMAVGLAMAMFIGGVFDSKRPMWIAIVTYAVTQPFLTDTLRRIFARSLGCIVGIFFFWALFKYVIDPKYSMMLMMVCGFLCSVPSQYEIQQIFVTINALGAAMILLDPSQSVTLRMAFLALGIVIALFCWAVMVRIIIPVYYSKGHKDISV